jgi:uncharacterized membrane protein HdeD (DUF308 family)
MQKAGKLWYLLLISGVISAGIGILVVAYPDPSLKLLGVFLGIDLLIVGGLMIVRGTAEDGESGSRAAMLLLGTIALIAGIMAVRNPGETIVLLVLAFAIYLIVAGALVLAHALVEREHRGLRLARGAVLVAAGSVIIAWPDLSLTTLAWLAGIALILQGALEIGEAFLVRGVARAERAA